MLERIEGGRRRGQQRMRWLDGITDTMDIVWVCFESWGWTGRPGVLQLMGSTDALFIQMGTYIHIHIYIYIYIYIHTHTHIYKTTVFIESESCSVMPDFCNPMEYNSMGFFRLDSWSGQPFLSPVDLPNPRIEPRSPTLQADSLSAEPQRKPFGYF